MDLAPQLAEDGLIDARPGHLGIGDDVAAAPQGLNALGHGPLGEYKILRIVKVRGGVDHPLDDQFIFRGDLRIAQQLRNDFKAAFFNIHGFDDFQHVYFSFRQAFRKFAAIRGYA